MFYFLERNMTKDKIRRKWYEIHVKYFYNKMSIYNFCVNENNNNNFVLCSG